MLENRKMMMRLFPELFARYRVLPVATTRTRCSRSSAPSRGRAEGPDGRAAHAGMYNSAYFEHAFLAQQMGSSWSRAGPVRRRRQVMMRTTRGLAGRRDLPPHR